MGPLPFVLVFLIPGAAVLGLWLGGAWTLSGVILTFILVPVFDGVLGLQTENPNPDAEAKLKNNFLYDLPLHLWVPVQGALIGCGIWAYAFGEYTPLELLGLTLSIGVVTGGGGINIAHELMHRPGRLQRALAEILMSSVSYTHFCVEHILGHHRWVATPKDPATAEAGEVLYRFWFRSIFGGLRSAWRLETKRVEGLRWTQDRRLRYPLVLASIYLSIFALTGWKGVLFFFLQSAVAVLLLETINYIEHYGLRRAMLPDGRYERVQPHHSWNSPHRLTAWLLFNLPRHSDHHFLASRPYPILRHHEQSPQLPAGYPTMMLLAMCPPLWRKVMDS